MRILTILGFLLLVYISQSLGKYEVIFQDADRECFKELGLDEEVVRDGFKVHFKLAEFDNHIAAFQECAWRKMNLLKRDFEWSEIKKWLKGWDLRAINEYLDIGNTEDVDQIVEKAVESCKSVRGSDISHSVVKIYNCLMDFMFAKRMF